MEENKCLKCNSESLGNTVHLCVSCNSGYYQKQDDNTNASPYFNCYNDVTISDGYYLNSELYEPCYPSCKKCNELGDDDEHKCTSCKEGYSNYKNNNNKENCYPTCNNYIYFNNTGFHCTEGNNCPIGYKLIRSTNRCIDNCQNDIAYHYNYEYNGECVENCPSTAHISTENNKLCVDDLICTSPDYYNYYRNECISNIPNGYYCNSTGNRTIDKCYDRCKTCNEGGTETQNNCQTCKDEYPYLIIIVMKNVLITIIMMQIEFIIALMMIIVQLIITKLFQIKKDVLMNVIMIIHIKLNIMENVKLPVQPELSCQIAVYVKKFLNQKDVN